MRFSRINPKILKQKYHTFCAFSWSDRFFVLLNIFILGFVQIALRVFSFKKILKYVGQPFYSGPSCTLITPQQRDAILRLRRLLALAQSYAPWHTTCLANALVARLWCKYSDLPYFLFIGVIKQQEKSWKEGHAWITSGPIAITGGDCFEQYYILSTYSSGFSHFGKR